LATQRGFVPSSSPLFVRRRRGRGRRTASTEGLAACAPRSLLHHDAIGGGPAGGGGNSFRTCGHDECRWARSGERS
jgi:hypothetical protein